MGRKINEAFFMRPWAIREEILNIMTEIVIRHVSGEKLSKEEIEARTAGANKKEANYEVSESGVARIPIYGIIAKRASMVNGISQSRGTSAEEIRKNVETAITDDKVRSIVFDIDSPGGSVDGVPELADFIYSVRGKKPMTAYVDGMMASAAYWIGSCADKIFATRSSEVGSIGVYAVVHDMHRALKNDGIDSKIFRAGKYKATGHPAKPMTEDDEALIQGAVDEYYGMFIDAVSKNRGISIDSALKLGDGRIHIGRKALDMGLIDGMGDIETHIQACDDEESRRRKMTAQKVKCADCKMEIDEKQAIKTAEGAVMCPACADKVNRAGAAVVDTNSSAKEVKMEIKDITLEVLKAQRPELVEAISKEAVQNAGKAQSGESVAKERARCLDIITAAEQYKDAGVDDIVKSSIEKGEEVVAAESAMKSKKLAAINLEAPISPGADADPALAAKTHLEKAEAYRKAHGGTLAAALSATAPIRK